MLKKITALTLFLLCSISIFAQIPPSSGYDKEEKPLLYIPSRDYKEPQYLFGVFNDYDRAYQTRYGLSQILNTGTVYFSITQEGTANKQTHFQNEEENIKNELENALNEENRKNELSNVVKQAFKLWFTEVRKTIKEEGRDEEFADIIPLLDRSVKPILVDYKPNRNFINFSFTTNTRMHSICDNNTRDVVAGACFDRATKEIFFPNPFTEELFYTRKALMGYLRTTTVPTLAHEIGHYYGLVDQYANFGHASSVYSTSDRYLKGSSMMGTAPEILCDDVDGFINLIDITLSKQNGWSQRAKNGWASFCNGKNVPHYTQDVTYKDTFYKMGRPVKSLAQKVSEPSSSQPKSSSNSNNNSQNKNAKSYPKPFTWHSDKYKYNFTYHKNSGLLATKRDDKYSYSYSYYKNTENVPTIKVSVASVEKPFIITQKTFDGHKYWELPVGYYIPETSGDMRYVYVDNNQCTIKNYVPFSDYKSYSLQYKNNVLQNDYTYTFNLADRKVIVHKYEKYRHPVCKVSYGSGSDPLPLVTFFDFSFTEDLDAISRDRVYLDSLAEQAKMTRKELIERLRTECKKVLHHTITDNSKELCSYFKDVNNYFNK